MLSLNKDEQVLHRARKHWFVFAVEFFFLLLLGVTPLFVAPVLPAVIPLAFLYSLWLIAVWIMIFAVWTDFYLDVWVITNKRIIDIEQKGFFHREIASCNLDDIQDITTTVAGFIPTLLNYGDLRIQTAGEAREFMLRSAAHPERVKQRVSELKTALLRS